MHFKNLVSKNARSLANLSRVPFSPLMPPPPPCLPFLSQNYQEEGEQRSLLPLQHMNPIPVPPSIKTPFFSARHGSGRAEEGFDISPIGHTTEKGGILHTWDGHAQLHVHILLCLSLSANFPHIRMEKKGKQIRMLYRNSFCWRHGGGGRDISARFRKKGNFHDCSSPKLQASQFLLFPLSSSS